MCNNYIILVVSIGREFENYDLLEKTLLNTKFDALSGIEHSFLVDFCHKNQYDAFLVPIEWSNTIGCTNIQTSKFGNAYNPDAPRIAAEKAIEDATHIIKFGTGDYNLNKIAKKNQLKEIEQKTKRYRF